MEASHTPSHYMHIYKTAQCNIQFLDHFWTQTTCIITCFPALTLTLKLQRNYLLLCLHVQQLHAAVSCRNVRKVRVPSSHHTDLMFCLSSEKEAIQVCTIAKVLLSQA